MRHAGGTRCQCVRPGISQSPGAHHRGFSRRRRHRHRGARGRAKTGGTVGPAGDRREPCRRQRRDRHRDRGARRAGWLHPVHGHAWQPRGQPAPVSEHGGRSPHRLCTDHPGGRRAFRAACASGSGGQKRPRTDRPGQGPPGRAHLLFVGVGRCAASRRGTVQAPRASRPHAHPLQGQRAQHAGRDGRPGFGHLRQPDPGPALHQGRPPACAGRTGQDTLAAIARRAHGGRSGRARL